MKVKNKILCALAITFSLSSFTFSSNIRAFSIETNSKDATYLTSIP